jgi:hypothetical protein
MQSVVAGESPIVAASRTLAPPQPATASSEQSASVVRPAPFWSPLPLSVDVVGRGRDGRDARDRDRASDGLGEFAIEHGVSPGV